MKLIYQQHNCRFSNGDENVKGEMKMTATPILSQVEGAELWGMGLLPGDKKQFCAFCYWATLLAICEAD
jgi:hypothetical protein